MQVVENMTDVQLESNRKACSDNGSLSLKSKTLPHMCTLTAGSLLAGIDVPQTSNPFSVEDPNKNQFHHWCWLDVHDVCGICNVFLRGLTTINMRVICNRVFFFEWHIPLDYGFVFMMQDKSILNATRCNITNNNATNGGAIYVWVSTTN